MHLDCVCGRIKKRHQTKKMVLIQPNFQGKGLLVYIIKDLANLQHNTHIEKNDRWNLRLDRTTTTKQCEISK